MSRYRSINLYTYVWYEKNFLFKQNKKEDIYQTSGNMCIFSFSIPFQLQPNACIKTEWREKRETKKKYEYIAQLPV